MSALRYYYGKYRTVLFYVVSTVSKAAAQIISVFLVAKFVEPQDLGLWTIANVFVTYSALLNLGIISGLNRELPFSLGKGNFSKAEELVAASMSYMWVSIILMLVLGSGVAAFYLKEGATKPLLCAVAVTLMSAMTFLENFLLATYRSNSSFNKLSVIQMLQTLLNIVTLVLIYYYGFIGLIYKTVFVQFVYVFFLYKSRPFRVRPKWDNTALWEVLKVGFPIYILAYLQSTAATFDRLLLARITDQVHLGYYSFGMYSFIALNLIPIAISNFIYPKLTYMYGKDNSGIALWGYFKKITVGMCLMLSPFAILVWFAAPYILAHFFPSYTEGLAPFRILAIAAVFMGGTVGSNVMLSMKKWKYIIIYQLCYIAFLVVMPLFMSFLYDDKVKGVAMGVLAAYILIFFVICIAVYFCTHEELK